MRPSPGSALGAAAAAVPWEGRRGRHAGVVGLSVVPVQQALGGAEHGGQDRQLASHLWGGRVRRQVGCSCRKSHPVAVRDVSVHQRAGDGSSRAPFSSPCGLRAAPPSERMTGQQPTVGVLKAEGAWACSMLPARKPPPISVPAQPGSKLLGTYDTYSCSYHSCQLPAPSQGRRGRGAPPQYSMTGLYPPRAMSQR